MRIRSYAIAVAIAVMWSQLPDADAAARCSYMATYPSAIGRNTFMLATATPGRLTATVDTPYVFGSRVVPAQVMRIENVTGFQADVIRDGLRASGGTAVFIRYQIGMSCAPSPALDGAFDSVGVSGLYVGRPRPAERWVDGRPTFDVFRAPHFPLPQRLSGPSGHLVMTRVDTTPTMTAEELFRMYSTLWAASVSVDDRSVEQRIRRWLATDRRVARKQPTREVAEGMVFAITDAKIAANLIPFGGTYAISVIVPGIDSLFLYGQTSYRTRLDIADVTRDSGTGTPLRAVPRAFAIGMTTARTLAGFVRPNAKLTPCSASIGIDQLPIVAAADSTWSGEMSPSDFFSCFPPSSVLFGLTLPGVKTSPVPLGATSVRFRQHADGRITFEARKIQDGKTVTLVRGERVSTQSYDSPFN